MSGGFSDILRSLEERDARKLERKVPSWSGVSVEIPQSIHFQQCSGEIAARYKASLVAPGARVADMTGGLGVDSWAFSLEASAVWYNEKDAVLRDAVRRNFAALGVSNVAFNGFDISPDASSWQEVLRDFAPDVIYLDPARRDAAGRKVFLLEDCSPDVLTLLPSLLSLAPVVMVKVSPMADITMLCRRLADYLASIHVVGADSECKELLCLCRRDAAFAGVTLFEDGFIYQQSDSFSATKESDELLFVPSAAMVKAGMGPGMCLMPFSEPLSHFGRFWQVIENLPFAASEIKTLRRRYPQADVTARGVPITSDQLRSKLHVTPGGPVHIFACSLSNSRRLLICTPYNPPIVP
ncbi:MAG: class I SAM-dependent methyltransferase [Bacteroidales bacterium]|nr:class I SAM-dependent methyltransferase [Bacteroidales bacterium]